MTAFIDQEANEKVEEIDAKVCYVVKQLVYLNEFTLAYIF